LDPGGLTPVFGDSPVDGILPKAGQGDPIPLDAPGSSTPAAQTQVELTLIGDYPNPWKNDPVTEARLVAASTTPPSGKPVPHWSPGTDTFTSVAQAEASGAGQIVVCADLDAILDTIIKQADHSVTRVNIISHGMTGGLGMKGEIKKTTHADPTDPNNSFVPGDVFFTNPSGGTNFITSALLSGASGTLASKRDQAQKKFAPGAGIFIYGCDSASDPALVQAIAKFFKVPATGFNAAVGYFPKIDSAKNPTKVTDRRQTGVDNGTNQPDPLFPPLVGFKHLDHEPPMSATTQNP
jgi:hypothetical protein